MSKKLAFLSIVLFAAVFLSACTGGPIRGSTWPGLTADEETAYLADGPFVYAINLRDGRRLWRYPEGADADLAFFSTPVITPDGNIIIGSSGTSYTLLALNPSDIDPETNTPAVEWTFEGAEDHWVAAPLLVGDQLFAVNADGNLYVLDLQDGQSTKQAVEVIPVGGRLWSQPITDGERIYITSLDHSVVAVDVNTSNVLWHADVEGAVPGSAVLGSDGMLYVGSLASQLVRFDPATGEHSPVLNSEYWIWSTPAVEGDALYFGDLEGNFYSYSTGTSSLNWQPVKPDGPITASPLVQNDKILLATESGSVFALDHEGNVLWSQAVGGKIYTTPVSAGGLTLVAPLEADFYLAALDDNGRQVWTFTEEN
jgi:outer membrane protein assembly factor BamB